MKYNIIVPTLPSSGRIKERNTFLISIPAEQERKSRIKIRVGLKKERKEKKEAERKSEVGQ